MLIDWFIIGSEWFIIVFHALEKVCVCFDLLRICGVTAVLFVFSGDVLPW